MIRRLAGMLGAAACASLCLAIGPASGVAEELHPWTGVAIDGEAEMGKGEEFKDACGVAVDSANYVYVADYYRNRILIFRVSELFGKKSIEIVNRIPNVNPLEPSGVLPVDGPCDLAVDSNHNVYVNDYHRDVQRLTPSAYPPTGAVTYTRQTIDSSESTGVAVDPVTDEVYVNNRDQVNVYPPSPMAATLPTRSVDLGPGADAYGVAASGFAATAGRLYVADANANAVRVFGPAGEPLEVIDGTGGPRAGFTSLVDSDLVVDPSDGHVFVVDNLQPHFESPEAVIYEFSPEGHYRGRTPSEGEGSISLVKHAEPSGLAISPAGEIYVTSGNRYLGNFRPEKSVVYIFGAGPAIATRLLSVTKTGPGTGVVVSSPYGLNCGTACVGELDLGSSVTLTAVPSRGSRLIGWSGCGSVSADGSCSLTMSTDRAVTAEFGLIPQRSLTVTKLGSGFGEVRSVPARIECGDVCADTFDEGATVTLTAKAAPANGFFGWSGCGSEPSPDKCQVTMSAARSVAATFLPTPRIEEEEVSQPRSRAPIPPLPSIAPGGATGTLRVTKVTTKGATATMRIAVPAPGEVSVTGKGLREASFAVLRRSEVNVALRLNAAGRRGLARAKRSRLAVPASIVFAPFSEGPALRAKKAVLFKRSQRAR